MIMASRLLKERLYEIEIKIDRIAIEYLRMAVQDLDLYIPKELVKLIQDYVVCIPVLKNRSKTMCILCNS